MDIIQDSKDILNLAIALSVFMVAAALAWLIAYFALIARQAYKAIESIKEKVQKVDAAISSFKEKMENSASYLFLIGEGIKKLVEIAREYKGEGKKGKKKV